MCLHVHKHEICPAIISGIEEDKKKGAEAKIEINALVSHASRPIRADQ